MIIELFLNHFLQKKYMRIIGIPDNFSIFPTIRIQYVDVIYFYIPYIVNRNPANRILPSPIF